MSRFAYLLLAAVLVCPLTGCSPTVEGVIEAPDQTQAEIDDYEAQMNSTDGEPEPE